jgi:hypothetical protein
MSIGDRDPAQARPRSGQLMVKDIWPAVNKYFAGVGSESPEICGDYHRLSDLRKILAVELTNLSPPNRRSGEPSK